MQADEIIFSQEQLEEKLLYWQENLRLRDWIIKVTIKRQREMSQSNRLGEVEFNIYTKTAMISVLDPIDYDDWGKQDMENTLVHELLHLHFSEINYHFGGQEDVYSVLEEQAIESIAHGLIKTERKCLERND